MAATEQPMTAVRHHVLEAQWRELIVRIELNGVAVEGDLSGAGNSFAMPVNMWLRPGRNWASIWLSGLLRKPRASELLRAELYVAEADPEGLPRPAAHLFKWEWPGEHPAIYPYRFAAEFEVEVPATRLWQEAEPVEELTEADRLALWEQLEAYRQALVAADVERAIELLRVRSAECELASGLAPGSVERAIRSQLRGMTASGPLRGEPLDLDQAEFEVVGEGRLVDVRRRGAEYALSFDTKYGPLRVRWYFARLGGKWVIAR